MVSEKYKGIDNSRRRFEMHSLNCELSELQRDFLEE